MDTNWFKLPSIASYRRNVKHGTMGHNSWHMHRRVWGFLQRLLLNSAEEERKRRAFFSTQQRWQDQYREHSRDLGNALYEWWKGQTLSYCEYKDGRYQPHGHLITQRAEIRNLKFATRHMRISNPQVERSISEVESKNDESCRKIIQLMVYRYAGSFETIIVNTIAKRCPSLQKVDDEQKLFDSGNKNRYVDHLIFDLIFRGADDPVLNPVKEEEIKISPISDEPKKNDQTTIHYKLEHTGVCLAIANQEQVLSELKQTIINLMFNKTIKTIVDKYHRTYNEQKIKMFEVRELADEWSAGNLKLEENYPVCEGCPTRPELER